LQLIRPLLRTFCRLLRLVAGAWVNVHRFRDGLVFKAHRLCVSLNSRLESNKEKTKKVRGRRAKPAFSLTAYSTRSDVTSEETMLPVRATV